MPFSAPPVLPADGRQPVGSIRQPVQDDRMHRLRGGKSPSHRQRKGLLPPLSTWHLGMRARCRNHLNVSARGIRSRRWELVNLLKHFVNECRRRSGQESLRSRHRPGPEAGVQQTDNERKKSVPCKAFLWLMLAVSSRTCDSLSRTDMKKPSRKSVVTQMYRVRSAAFRYKRKKVRSTTWLGRVAVTCQ